MASLSAWKQLYNLLRKRFIVPAGCLVDSRLLNCVFSGQKGTEEFLYGHLKSNRLFPRVMIYLSSMSCFTFLPKQFNSGITGSYVIRRSNTEAIFYPFVLLSLPGFILLG